MNDEKKTENRKSCDIVPLLTLRQNLPEYKSVLLIVFNYDERELLLLEVQLCDLGPEKEANLGFPFEHEDAGGCQAQAE
jgi:hypothetical protein